MLGIPENTNRSLGLWAPGSDATSRACRAAYHSWSCPRPSPPGAKTSLISSGMDLDAPFSLCLLRPWLHILLVRGILEPERRSPKVSPAGRKFHKSKARQGSGRRDADLLLTLESALTMRTLQGVASSNAASTRTCSACSVSCGDLPSDSGVLEPQPTPHVSQQRVCSMQGLKADSSRCVMTPPGHWLSANSALSISQVRTNSRELFLPGSGSGFRSVP